MTRRLNEDVDLLTGLTQENKLLRQEIRVAREAAEITASLVAQQFEETEKLLRRFQTANAQRRAVLNSATNIAIIATNNKGVIRVFNTGAENLLGYKAKEVIGKMTPLEFEQPKELEAKSRALSRECNRPIHGLEVFFEYARQARSNQHEWTFVRKDGSTFPASISINALKEADETVSGFLFIANDITEKKIADKALMESREKYRLLINNLPNVIYNGYSDGRLDFIDDKIESVLGYSNEDFTKGGITWFDLVVPDDLDEAMGVFMDALKNDKTYIREYRVWSKNCEMVWIQEGGQILTDEKGEIDFVTGAFLDITERKLAENAMIESQEKYRSLFDSGPNPIFVLDHSSFEILDANPRALETYDYTLPELMGKNFVDLGTFECIDYMTPGKNKADPMTCQKVRHFKKGERPFYVNYETCPTIYNGRGALILAITDITEMVEKDAQLIQASKMTTLGEMSAGIAHELNQPLNTIRIGGEYLRTMAETGQPIPQTDLLSVVEEITSQVDRASEIINRLRAFGRKTDFEKEIVNINDPVNNVLGIIGKQLDVENTTIELELEDNLPPFLAHNNRIEQILFNLITNARDAINQKLAAADTATDTGPDSIKIKTWGAGDQVFMSVCDTGGGIIAENRDKIFEPFFTTKEVGKGMGLGLSIIYGIVRDYGGEIELYTEDGQGSKFEFAFPILKRKNRGKK